MKISTTKQKLLEAIQISERIVGKKESLPILSCILIDAGEKLYLRATNLESGVEIQVPSEITVKGSIAVPAGILSQTIRSVTAETLTLSSEEGNLLLEARGTKTVIKAIPHDEFPALSKDVKKGNVELPREKLMHGIQAVSYAASPSMIRPDLGSVFLSIKDGAITAVATDSFRLAEKRVSDASKAGESELLIPLRHALELVHILERLDAPSIAIGTDDAQLSVTGGGLRYVSRIVEANFPNYKEIIPKTFATEATVLKSDFAEMLRKARVFSGNDQHVGFHIYPKKKIFSVTARSANVGEMSDSVDAALSGEDLDINFHIGYLSECLTSIESDSVALSFAGTGKPLVIKGVSDGTFTYLVMPLNR